MITSVLVLALATQASSAATPADVTEAQAAWVRAMQAQIVSHWTPPLPDASDRFPCRVKVRLLPTGTVAYAETLAPCSGSGALARSVEAAVMKSSPLPLPSHPAAFHRTLILAFVPGPDAAGKPTSSEAGP